MFVYIVPVCVCVPAAFEARAVKWVSVLRECETLLNECQKMQNPALDLIKHHSRHKQTGQKETL